MVNIFRSMLVLAVLVFHSTVQAVPVYSSDTSADFGSRPGSRASENPAGFYIWSNDTYDQWSVRWTGNHFGEVLVGHWGGQLALTDLASGSVREVRFEARQNDGVYVYEDVDGYEDYIHFDGRSGRGYDGIDFMLKPEDNAMLSLRLWSTLFTDLVASSSPVAATGIYIGEDYDIPMVDVFQHGDKATQNFTIDVPEPSTLALLGLGFVGIGAARMARMKS
jgi:hypothetical protein